MIAQKHNYKPMQNLDISLFVLIVLVALTYIPGSPTMYMHMVNARKKQFAKLKGEQKKKETWLSDDYDDRDV